MKIAALDVGLKRIGVALCFDRSIVLPQLAIVRRNRNQAARDTVQFLSEWEVNTVIVGLPRGGSSEEEMERRIRHFVGLLALPKVIAVQYQDEQGSSAEAKEQMAGEIRQRRDGRIDSLAAKIILERWLASGQKAIN
jgi:putative Holliday junction resolvase